MTGYHIALLKEIVEEIGEEEAKRALSDFSCPINEDVEEFLHAKAIEFGKHGISSTHLVYCSYKDQPVIAGYFALATKPVGVQLSRLSKTYQKRLKKFAQGVSGDVAILSMPLIGQLAKNYKYKSCSLITGSELLALAENEIKKTQLILGGRFVYLECADLSDLIRFYEDNGYVIFGRRELDADEKGPEDVDSLIQLLKVLKP